MKAQLLDIEDDHFILLYNYTFTLKVNLMCSYMIRSRVFYVFIIKFPKSSSSKMIFKKFKTYRALQHKPL